MKRLLAVCALVAVCATSAAWAATATSEPSAPTGAARAAADGKFVVTFPKPANADEQFLVELLKVSKVADVMRQVGKAFVLPYNVKIRFVRQDAGPYYDPSRKEIVYGLPFTALTLRLFKAEYPKITNYRLGELFAELTYFVLFHEVGHAFVDIFDIPVIGREEDAADAFSTIYMVRVVGHPLGGEIAIAGADFFDYLHRQQALDDVAFADEHSLNKQRAYSILCWVYGSSPKAWSGLAEFLPEGRRVRCPSEYASLEKAWIKLLKPYIR